MTWTLENFMRAASHVAEKKVMEDLRKRIYELSRDLPTDEGYNLMELYDAAIKYAIKSGEREATRTTQEDDE